MGKKRTNKNKKGSLRLPLKETGSTTRPVVSLPEELITEILVRLPVKSLLRFKCVSKSWLSLISSPQFIRSHSSMEPDGSNLQVLYVSKASMTMRKCRLYSAMKRPIYTARHLSIESPYFRRLIGIINGLVCLHLFKTDLCVWNPALKKIKCFNLFPEAPEAPSGTVTYRRFSFGYEEFNDDYKVVCLQTVKGRGNDFDAEVSIYSLKADSCRRIDQLKGFHVPNPGVFANGKIYWFGNLVGTPERKIVSLDMSSEKFVELQHPDFPDFDDSSYRFQLGVSGGRLFVLCDYFEGEKVDMWVLDKCGVEESWCKVVSFTYPDVNHKFRSIYDDTLYFDYRVLCISSNGEIVFGNGYGLFVYNGKKGVYRKIKLVVDTTTCWTADAYVESLVWPSYA